MFSVSVLHDERIVVVAEQRPDASEEDSFQWMSRVLQVLSALHVIDLTSYSIQSTLLYLRFGSFLLVSADQVVSTECCRHQF